MTFNTLAREYVSLVLSLGKHHKYYIDAYYGPDELRSDTLISLDDLLLSFNTLIKKVDAFVIDEAQVRRKEFLYLHLLSARTFLKMIQGEKISFNEESKALFDAVSPVVEEDTLNTYLDELSSLLSSPASLNTAMNHFMQDFIIPRDKLDLVFKAAMSESRLRCKEYIDLASNENFEIKYVQDQVWSAYNWYKGNNYSVIELNTDFPMYISRALDLACHEAYPGHHVFNSLMEKHLFNEKGFIEYSVYTLYSPLSLLAEGSANYGIELCFDEKSKRDFEVNVLFPLALIDKKKAALYYKVQEVLKKLSYAVNMIAQQYLDSLISEEKAIELLMKYNLSSKEKSIQRLAFIKANRSYVINYNLGEDIVKDYINKHKKNGSEKEKWAIFHDLLKNPKTASMMLRT
ncbi:MAG: hypothetical protein COA66_11870 [Arcobacter sp.]|nr:MAG: hypothetical protein COA66_11870 [Arcobacter sp.]